MLCGRSRMRPNKPLEPTSAAVATRLKVKDVGQIEMPPESSPWPPQRRIPWGRFVVACCLGAVLLAPRGVTVVVFSDAKRPLVMRADVQGDSAVSAPIKPGTSDGVVVCPQGDSSIVVTVNDGRTTGSHDLDVYLDARTVGAASVEVAQHEGPDAPLVFEDVRFQRWSMVWGLLPQSLLARGVLLGLAIALLASAVQSVRRR